MTEIKTVGVVGCGLMGSGIAEVCARAGFDTIVCEVNQEALDKGLQRMKGSVENAVGRGKMSPEDAEATLGRIQATLDLNDLAGADVVIEAIVENLQKKAELFSRLDDIVKPEAIFATNTSSLSITNLSTATARADRFLGLHFFNPVPVLPLVEIVRGLGTGDEALARARQFAAALGKEAVEAKDTPGFIVNLLLVPFMLDAIRALESGVAKRDDIDKAMKLGCGHPMGPFRLLDLVGLDTTLSISEILYREFKDDRYAAPPLLRRMVEAGWYGRKTGRGFYDYNQPAPAQSRPTPAAAKKAEKAEAAEEEETEKEEPQTASAEAGDSEDES